MYLYVERRYRWNTKRLYDHFGLFPWPRSRPSKEISFFPTFFLRSNFSISYLWPACDFRNFILLIIEKSMPRVPFRHNDLHLRTWIKSLTIKRECCMTHAEENRWERMRERERESFMIDHVLFRKLPGNRKAQPRRFPSLTIRSIEEKLVIFDTVEEAGQKLSS